MADSEWIELDPDILNESTPQLNDNGVEVVVGLSPFDIPEAVRGYMNAQLNRFVIEFRYLGEEERRVPQKLNDFINLRIGENSNRPYEILIDVTALKADTVKLLVVLKEALEKVAVEKANPRKQAFFRMAGSIVKDKETELMSAH